MFPTIRCILAGLLGVLVAITPAEAGSPFDTGSEPFPADVYPSRKGAIDRLVAQVVRDLVEDPNFCPDEMSFEFSRNGIEAETLNEFVVSRFRSAFSTASVKMTETPHADERTMSVAIVASESASSSQPLSKSNQAMLNQRDGRVSISYGGGKIGTRTVSAQFIEKPWADNWAMFLNMNPSTRWLSATSQTPCTSDNEAIAAARETAVPALSDLVLTEMRARNARSSGPKIPVTEEWVRNLVSDSLKRNLNGLIIKDTFIQKFSRPYGDVWQASILIDASPKVIGILNDSYNNAANAQFGKKATGLGAIGAMVLVIGLLYAFINAVTKGYFMWRLRAVALLAAIAGVLAVFAVT